jgi:hypothetical protein
MNPTPKEVYNSIQSLDPEIREERSRDRDPRRQILLHIPSRDNCFFMEEPTPRKPLPPDPLPFAFWRGVLAALIIEAAAGLVVFLAIWGWRL